MPNIPNGFNQVMLLIFMVIFFYPYYHANARLETFEDRLYGNSEDLNWSELASDTFYNSIKIKKISDKLSIAEKDLFDSNHLLNKKIITEFNKKESLYKDSLLKFYERNIIADSKMNQILSKELLLNRQIQEQLKKVKLSLILAGIGAIFIFSVLFEIARESNLESKFLKIQLHEKRIYKSCQSCARYFSPKLLHGKNKDGTNNIGFCDRCYKDGGFTNPKLTAEDVIAEIKNHNPKEKDVDKKVNEMVRWNQNPYVDNYKF